MLPIRRFLRLTPADVGLAAAAWVALCRARARLWWQRSPDLVAPAVRTESPRAHDAASLARAVSRAVSLTSPFVPAATCLVQALAAQHLLARRGIGTDLRLGVARGEDGRVAAHAWLEHQGEIVLGSGERTYQPLR